MITRRRYRAGLYQAGVACPCLARPSRTRPARESEADRRFDRIDRLLSTVRIMTIMTAAVLGVSALLAWLT